MKLLLIDVIVFEKCRGIKKANGYMHFTRSMEK